MKVLLFVFPFLLLGIIACQHSTKAKFVLNNQTGDAIDSIKIIPNRDSTHLYSSLMTEEVGTYYADLSNIHSDGNYTLTFKKWTTGQHYSFNFGYFSNGKPSEKQLFLEVWRDTIIVKSKMEDF